MKFFSVLIRDFYCLWDAIIESELSSCPRRPLALPMLNQLFDRLQRDILLKAQWFDDLTSFDKDIALDHSLVGLLGIPLFTNRHTHQCIELLGAIVLIGKVLDPVLLCKLLVTLLSLIDLNTSKLGILALLFNLFDLFLSRSINLLLSTLIA